ncbi:MAG: hypothetical protein AMXMBFR64_60420 [Myxococcales bacterium]
MKLATRRNGTRDGELLVVSRDNLRATRVDVAPTLQALLDDWERLAPKAEELYAQLNAEVIGGEPLEAGQLHSPLPRAYAWIDGSAYINHIVLVRRARGAEPPATLRTDPLVYQGGSDTFLDPTGEIPVEDLAWGADFEGEIAIVTGDVPQGTASRDAGQHVRLLMLCNDVSLRNLIPAELAKGFGFFTSKPSSAFSPLAVTPDELGDAWVDGRVHLPLLTHLNGAQFGDPDAGPEMHFSFYDLIAHVTKTRALGAGTIIGSGTVSNEDTARGSSCLAERRMLEIIATGAAVTPFLRYGDRVTMEMRRGNESLFGRIDHVVAPPRGAGRS